MRKHKQWLPMAAWAAIVSVGMLGMEADLASAADKTGNHPSHKTGQSPAKKTGNHPSHKTGQSPAKKTGAHPGKSKPGSGGKPKPAGHLPKPAR